MWLNPWNEPDLKDQVASKWSERSLLFWVGLVSGGYMLILIAATALVILIYTILAKTLGVTNEYYLSMDTEIALSDRDRGRVEDPNPRVIPALNKVVRSGIQDLVPGDLGRSEKRALSGLLSTDAGLELGKIVKANPGLEGETYHYEALLDDQVQLYLKGDFGRLTDAGTHGDITITAGEAEGEVIITTVPNAFGEARQIMQEDRGREARAYRRLAGNEGRAFDET